MACLEYVLNVKRNTEEAHHDSEKESRDEKGLFYFSDLNMNRNIQPS